MLACLKCFCLFIICFSLQSCSWIRLPQSKNKATITASDGTSVVATPELSSEINTAISAGTTADPAYQLSSDETKQLKDMNLVSDSDLVVLNQYLTK
jgi:hypothetical protein